MEARYSQRYGWTLQKTTDTNYCENCGRPEHEGRLVEQFIDGDNKPIEIVVCDHYRKQEKFDELA
jgi:hypothetical protein